MFWLVVIHLWWYSWRNNIHKGGDTIHYWILSWGGQHSQRGGHYSPVNTAAGGTSNCIMLTDWPFFWNWPPGDQPFWQQLTHTRALTHNMHTQITICDNITLTFISLPFCFTEWLHHSTKQMRNNCTPDGCKMESSRAVQMAWQTHVLRSLSFCWLHPLSTRVTWSNSSTRARTTQHSNTNHSCFILQSGTQLFAIIVYTDWTTVITLFTTKPFRTVAL